jgi:hypothetical protein
MDSASLNAPDLPASILILAPQGAESQAIAKGLRTSQKDPNPRFFLQSMPVGQPALVPFLANLGKPWEKIPKPQALLVMGVTGSLSPHYGIGQPVWVKECQPWPPAKLTRPYQSDLHFSQAMATLLADGNAASIPSVKGITVNQVIGQASAKQALAQESGAEVVDMENVAILQFAQQHRLPIAVLRVVSDTVTHDLPDLANIYDANGNLKPWTLATRFLRQPGAAARLIQGSLIACHRLQQLATILGTAA